MVVKHMGDVCGQRSISKNSHDEFFDSVKCLPGRGLGSTLTLKNKTNITYKYKARASKRNFILKIL